MATSPAPLVSVCFLTFNHAAFVEEALRSALEQVYEPLEVVVADDGSTDGTYDIVCEVASRYPGRARVLPQSRNVGVTGIVRNYNRALEACSGELIAFLEGDDVFLPGKVAAQAAWFAASETRVLCGHDVEVFDSSTAQRLYLWSQRHGLPAGRGPNRVIRRGVPFSTVATMVRRRVVPQGGFDDRLRVVLDRMFWIECLWGGGEFGAVGGVYARYRRHPGNVSSKFALIGRDDELMTLALVESRDPALGRHCRCGRATVFLAHGLHQALHGPPSSLSRARSELWNAATTSPSVAPKAFVGLVLSLVPPGLAKRLLALLGRK